MHGRPAHWWGIKGNSSVQVKDGSVLIARVKMHCSRFYGKLDPSGDARYGGRMIAAMELGGTKTVVAIGKSDGSVDEEYRFPTSTPEETFKAAIEWFSSKGSPEKIGIAAFGPVQINPKAENWGEILPTPKPNWSGFSITKSLLEAFPA